MTCLLLRSPATTTVVNAEKILSMSVLLTGAVEGRYVETNSSCSLLCRHMQTATASSRPMLGKINSSFFGSNLVSLMAAISILFAYKKHSSSCFLW